MCSIFRLLFLNFDSVDGLHVRSVIQLLFKCYVNADESG